MKPMGPAAAVAPPARSAIATSTTTRVRWGWAPMATAAASPRERASSARGLSAAISRPIRTNGAIWRVASSGWEAVVPADQPRIRSSTEEFVNSTAEVNPESTAPSATPASVIRIGLPRAGPVVPIAKTSTEVTMAPAKDHHMYWEMSVIPKKARPVTTASEAPEFTPRIPGSVIGLRVTACISPPATPSAAPASSTSAVRGTRESQTSWETWSAGSGRSRKRSTSPGGIDREPTSMLAPRASRHSSTRGSRSSRRRRRKAGACPASSTSSAARSLETVSVSGEEAIRAQATSSEDSTSAVTSVSQSA